MARRALVGAGWLEAVPLRSLQRLGYGGRLMVGYHKSSPGIPQALRVRAGTAQ